MALLNSSVSEVCQDDSSGVGNDIVIDVAVGEYESTSVGHDVVYKYENTLSLAIFQ